MGGLRAEGGAVDRPTLVKNINTRFDAESVQQSVTGLPTSRGDFLTICRKAGVLGELSNQQFKRYRARTNTVIPPLLQQILTTAFRRALSASPPVPLQIEINPTAHPSVEVRESERLVSIVLNRPDPQPFAR